MNPRAVLAILAIVAVLAVSGCAKAPSTSQPDPQLLGTWHLVLDTQHGLTVPTGAEDITLTIGDSKHTGGASPCARYRASVTGGPGAVFVDASFIGRNVQCVDPGLNAVDGQYLTALIAATHASIDGGVLVLSSPQTSLVYLKPVFSSLGTLRNTRWVFVQPPDLRQSTAVSLTFGASNQLTVTTPCSTTIAHYLLVEDIIILRGVATMPIDNRTCTPVDRVAQAVLTGELTADVSRATKAGPATLVLTNRANEEPLLWRSS